MVIKKGAAVLHTIDTALIWFALKRENFTHSWLLSSFRPHSTHTAAHAAVAESNNDAARKAIFHRPLLLIRFNRLPLPPYTLHTYMHKTKVFYCRLPSDFHVGLQLERSPSPPCHLPATSQPSPFTSPSPSCRTRRIQVLFKALQGVRTSCCDTTRSHFQVEPKNAETQKSWCLWSAGTVALG